MSNRDPGEFEREFTAGLRRAGDGLLPDAGLEARVRDRLSMRRRRRTVLHAASATVVVLCLGVSAVVLANDDPPEQLTTTDSSSTPSSAASLDTADSVDSVEDTTSGATPNETFPSSGDGGAVNILVVGTDNGACLRADSPYAAAFGDRSSIGERGDTIMIVRVDPTNDRASILSFPRDLWLDIDGGARGRLNSAFVRNDPQRLVDTIYGNFGIAVDHFVQLDFCGFTTIVDAVGGVSVPFDRPARDVHTGLFVPQAGCHVFGGEEALAYVRSRHYEWFDGSTWVADGSADLGRIARQQDFVQRMMFAVFGGGLTDPGRVRDLIGAVQDYVVVDRDLTISRMIELAGELRSMDAAAIGNYQVEGEPQTVAGNAVLVPKVEGPAMRAVLDLFRGRPLVPATDVTPAVAETSAPADVTAGSPGTGDSVPLMFPGNQRGVVPPAVTCP
jgi:LCP family protein required for cell wall assembly